MKSTSNSAKWVSQTFNQEGTDSNWVRADVSYEESFDKLNLANVTQSATSLKVLNDYSPVTAGQSLRLYNSTDGEVSTTATIGSNSITDGQKSFNQSVTGDSPLEVTPSSSPTFNSVFASQGQSQSGQYRYNEDGSKLYLWGPYTGGMKVYSMTTPYRPVDGVTYTGSITFNDSVLATLYNPFFPNWNFTQGGDKMVVWNASDSSGNVYYEIFDLSTPFDPATATLNKAYTNKYIGSNTASTLVYNSTLATTANTTTASQRRSIIERGGICNIQFSADGTRVFIGRAYTTANNLVYSSSYFYSHSYVLRLTTPYDIHSAVGISVINNTALGNSSSDIPIDQRISNDGTTLYSVHKTSNNYMYCYAMGMSSAWGGGIPADNSFIPNIVTAGSTSVITITSNWQQYNYTTGDNNIVFIDGGKRIGVYGSYTYEHSQNPAVATQWANGYIELDISSSGVTQTPETVSKSNSDTSDVKILAGTTSEVGKIGKSLLISPSSTTSSLVLYGDSVYGNSSLSTGDVIEVDGTEKTAGTVTESADHISTTFSGFYGTATTAPTSSVVESVWRNTHASGEELSKFHGIYNMGAGQFREMSTSSYESRATFFMSPDGKRLYTNIMQQESGYTHHDEQFAMWEMATPYHVGSASFIGYSGRFTPAQPTHSGWSASDQINNPLNSATFNADGTVLNVIGASSDVNDTIICTFPLAAPYDIASGSTGNFSARCTYELGQERIIRHDWSDDGRICFLVRSATSTSWMGTSDNIGLYWSQAATPFDITSLSQPTFVTSGSGFAYDIVGGGTYDKGYKCIITGFNGSSAQARGYFFSGDMSATSQVNFFTWSSPTSTSGPWEDYYNAGRTSGRQHGLFKSPLGDKIYHADYDGAIGQFTMPIGVFEDKYTIDMSSQSLSGVPSSVIYGNPTYDSLGTATKTAGATKNTYTYPSKTINARSMKLEVSADSGANISKLDVDLFT
jgi:hypothetical protein